MRCSPRPRDAATLGAAAAAGGAGGQARRPGPPGSSAAVKGPSGHREAPRLLIPGGAESERGHIGDSRWHLVIGQRRPEKDEKRDRYPRVRPLSGSVSHPFSLENGRSPGWSRGLRRPSERV